MASILILGASYGSLLATRLALAGHNVCLVCTEPTAELINREGTSVRFPLRGRPGLLEVRSRELRRVVLACSPRDAQPSQFDMCVLGMQEPQYSEPEVRQLMQRVARVRIPALAIMNMPPLAYLRRIEALNVDALRDAYAAPEVWDEFDPNLVSLASPDPQAFRPPGEKKNVLQVGLATNFKASAFPHPQHASLLHRLAQDIESSRLVSGDESLELPVKLKVHESPFVPFAKWPMLLTGNYRCVQSGGPVSIRDAVHSDLEKSREIYAWVTELCCRIGATSDQLVTFDKYAAAADGLLKPSSVARALQAGQSRIERVDRLVQSIARQVGMSNDDLDDIVSRIEASIAAASHSSAPALKTGS